MVTLKVHETEIDKIKSGKECLMKSPLQLYRNYIVSHLTMDIE